MVRVCCLILGMAVCAALWMSPRASAQSIDDYVNTFRILSSKASEQPTDASCKAAKEFWDLLLVLQKDEHEQHKLKGKAGFGFHSDETSGESSSEFHNVNASVNLSRGSYPGELNVTSKIDVTIKGGKFSENVSILNLTYDYYPRPWLEGFVFVDRLNNSFLEIDQRYEVGGGVVLDSNPWTLLLKDRHILTGAGRDLLDSLAVSGTTRVFGYKENHPTRNESAWKDPAWFDCYVKAVTKTARPSREQREKHRKEVKRLMSRLHDRWSQVKEGVRKQYARLRGALLVGAFMELEKATLAVKDTAANKEVSLPLKGTQTFRWELRPTLALRLTDALKLRGDYYYKGSFKGQQWFFHKDADYRTDLQLTLDATLKGADFGQKGTVTLSVSFRR
ncbi:MAG: hypothetical protein ACE5G0_21185, partial [Rhodothermales bacterium]